MSYLIGGGQIVVGIAVLVLWWLALMFLSRRNVGRPMTSFGFAVTPSVLLLWATIGGILIIRGIGGL